MAGESLIACILSYGFPKALPPRLRLSLLAKSERLGWRGAASATLTYQVKQLTFVCGQLLVRRICPQAYYELLLPILVYSQEFAKGKIQERGRDGCARHAPAIDKQVDDRRGFRSHLSRFRAGFREHRASHEPAPREQEHPAASSRCPRNQQH